MVNGQLLVAGRMQKADLYIYLHPIDSIDSIDPVSLRRRLHNASQTPYQKLISLIACPSPIHHEPKDSSPHPLVPSSIYKAASPPPRCASSVGSSNFIDSVTFFVLLHPTTAERDPNPRPQPQIRLYRPTVSSLTHSFQHLVTYRLNRESI